ncbi:hypothetical protein SSPIM334S_02630 [Streptomyces spiroverticillatus]
MFARKLFRLAVANPLSAAYLGVVGAVVLFEVVAALVGGGHDMAGIWVGMVTMPASLPLVMFAVNETGEPNLALYGVGLVVGVGLQSLAMGLLWKLVRSDRARGGRPLHS